MELHKLAYRWPQFEQLSLVLGVRRSGKDEQHEDLLEPDGAEVGLAALDGVVDGVAADGEQAVRHHGKERVVRVLDFEGHLALLLSEITIAEWEERGRRSIFIRIVRKVQGHRTARARVYA